MFSNDNQKDIFKKLGEPGSLTNPTAAVTASLSSASAELQARLEEIAPPVVETVVPPGPAEPIYYPFVREASAMYTAAASLVTGAASGMMEHAGSMVADMAGTVGRFEAATKINRAIVLPGGCTDIMDAMGSIGGPAQKDIGALGDVVAALGVLVPAVAEFEKMTLPELEQWKARFLGEVESWKAKGEALDGKLLAEKAKQIELDAVLSRFGVSSMLPGWANDPCLQAVVKQCASDELQQLLPN